MRKQLSVVCLKPWTTDVPVVHYSSSRMRFMSHNWSATKKRLHPQSVAEIRRHSVLSGDWIRQCETSSGSLRKASQMSYKSYIFKIVLFCPIFCDLSYISYKLLNVKCGSSIVVVYSALALCRVRNGKFCFEKIISERLTSALKTGKQTEILLSQALLELAVKRMSTRD